MLETGPDVLWYLDNMTAWVLELKTQKKTGNNYSKSEVAQVFDHVQFVRATKNATKIIPAIVGPLLPADHRANPSDDFLIIEVAALVNLRKRVREALETLAANRLPVLLNEEVARVYGDSGLLWSVLSENPPGTPIKSIEALQRPAAFE